MSLKNFSIHFFIVGKYIFSTFVNAVISPLSLSLGSVKTVSAKGLIVTSLSFYHGERKTFSQVTPTITYYDGKNWGERGWGERRRCRGGGRERGRRGEGKNSLPIE